MADSPNVLSQEEIMERLAPLFQNKELKLVLLFGSVASGKTHSKSDLDLAFLFDRPTDIPELTNRVLRCLRADNVDVVDLNRASPLLRFAVAQQGKLLYERSAGEFNNFVSLSFRRYIDTKKLRDMRASSITQFLEARGIL